MALAVVDVVDQQPADRRGLIHEEGSERIRAHRPVHLAESRMPDDSIHLPVD
jgi:hypothetical protein